MLVTFGTKRVNTGFVQIFGSKILKDFGQPFFQNNNFFPDSRLSNRSSIETLKNAGTKLFFMMRTRGLGRLGGIVGSFLQMILDRK